MNRGIIIIKKKVGSIKMATSLTSIVDQYLKAKEIIIDEGYAHEIDWQYELEFTTICEIDLLREAAWVILSSGMREKTIRNKFQAISKTFGYWESACNISRRASLYKKRALKIFNHEKKIDAIVYIAREIELLGVDRFKASIESEGIDFIISMPYMGRATSYHYAKNIGFDVVKPDRHLIRITSATGYKSPNHLCQAISDEVGDRLSVIDLVLWRFATLRTDYIKFFVV